MIPTQNLLSAVQFRVGDPQGVTFSDYEITEALNVAITKIYTTGAARNMNFALRKKVLVVENGTDPLFPRDSVPLPTDFFRVRKVYGEDGKELAYSPGASIESGGYRIFGDTIEVPEGLYSMEYFYIPSRAGEDSGAYPIPKSLESIVADVAAALLRKGTPETEAAIASGLLKLTAHENSGYLDMGPVEVWGGKA
jgi:hypothetical protein